MSSIRRITKQNKKYPRLLKEIFKPPVLYVRGGFKKADNSAIAIVGTRTPTHYGKQVAHKLAYDLAQSGLTIISGLALGIDTIAHKTALEAHGRTIAVLGSGIDDKSFYPQENKKLALEIEKSGAVISEYPAGTSAKPGYFPQRNRIVAGLCLGTLIIEAGYKSGALITAHCALDQNREVFCVPGSIFSEKSAGANNLIKLGAKLVTSAKDVLEELNLTQTLKLFAAEKIIPDNKEEAKILKFLNHEPKHIDELIKKTKLSPAVLSAAISMMEIKAKIKNIGGGNYVLGR
ncbi:MAG: DNA-processing protein DprA [bacterium]